MFRVRGYPDGMTNAGVRMFWVRGYPEERQTLRLECPRVRGYPDGMTNAEVRMPPGTRLPGWSDKR